MFKKQIFLAGMCSIFSTPIIAVNAQLLPVGRTAVDVGAGVGAGVNGTGAGGEATNNGNVTFSGNGRLTSRPSSITYVSVLAQARASLGQDPSVSTRLDAQLLVMPECDGAVPAGSRRLCWVFPVFASGDASYNFDHGGGATSAQVGGGAGGIVRWGQNNYVAMTVDAAIAHLLVTGPRAGAIGNGAGANAVLFGFGLDLFVSSGSRDRRGNPVGTRVRAHFQTGPAFNAWLHDPQNRQQVFLVPLAEFNRSTEVSPGQAHHGNLDVEVPIYTFRRGALQSIGIEMHGEYTAIRASVTGTASERFGNLNWTQTPNWLSGQGILGVWFRFL